MEGYHKKLTNYVAMYELGLHKLIEDWRHIDFRLTFSVHVRKIRHPKNYSRLFFLSLIHKKKSPFCMNSVRISPSLFIYARVCIRVFIVGCLKSIISNSNRISWNECILQVNLIYHSKAALKIKCRKLNYPLTMSSKFIDCMPLKKHGAFCYCGWKRKTIASDTKEKNLQLGRKKRTDWRPSHD